MSQVNGEQPEPNLVDNLTEAVFGKLHPYLEKAKQQRSNQTKLLISGPVLASVFVWIVYKWMDEHNDTKYTKIEKFSEFQKTQEVIHSKVSSDITTHKKEIEDIKLKAAENHGILTGLRESAARIEAKIDKVNNNGGQ